MTEVGILHREDTGALAVIKVVDPLGVGDVELDPDLPLGFANAIEGWLKDEHGYDYADVVARSAGARTEGRKKLEMLGVLDLADFAPRADVHVEIQFDDSAFQVEMQRTLAAMPDFPEDPPGMARVEKPNWTPPPQMIEKYARPEPRGDGIPILAEAHAQSLEASEEPTVFDGPAPAGDGPVGREAGRYRGPRNPTARRADGWLQRAEAWLRERFAPVKEEQ